MEDIEKAFYEGMLRRERTRFVKRIDAVLQKTASGAMPKQEQAATLRKMAAQIEREAAGDPVQRSQARTAERDEYPNRRFFQPKPAKPSDEMRERWLADAQRRKGLKRLPVRDRGREPER